MTKTLNILLAVSVVSVLFVMAPLSLNAAGDDACTVTLGGNCQYKPCPSGKAEISGKCMSKPADSNYICCVPNTGTSGGKLTGSGSTAGTGGKVSIPNPIIGVKSIAELIARINSWLLWISAPILTLMILIGAFQLMTGAGEPDKITKGKHTITWAVIGYALLLLSTGLTAIIKEVLGAQ